MERRKYERISIELPLDYRSNKFLQFRKARNISLNGVFLETENIEPKGTKVKLSFYFEGAGEALESEGEIVWNRAQTEKKDGVGYPVGMGIRFTKLSILANRGIDKKIKIKSNNSGDTLFN
ncbi:MAG: PilZ domain-containing protein [Candidatus Omnitrophota bacterium]